MVQRFDFLARIYEAAQVIIKWRRTPFHAAMRVTYCFLDRAAQSEPLKRVPDKPLCWRATYDFWPKKDSNVLTALRPGEPLHPSCPGIFPSHHYVFPVDNQPGQRPSAAPVRRDVGRSLPDEQIGAAPP